jgi:hypothetical protein
MVGSSQSDLAELVTRHFAMGDVVLRVPTSVALRLVNSDDMIDIAYGADDVALLPPTIYHHLHLTFEHAPELATGNAVAVHQDGGQLPVTLPIQDWI